MFWIIFSRSTHKVRVEWFHIDVSDGAAGKRPYLGFMFESSSNLYNEVKPDISVKISHFLTENTYISHNMFNIKTEKHDFAPYLRV